MKGAADNIFDRNYTTSLLTKQMMAEASDLHNGKYAVFVTLLEVY